MAEPQTSTGDAKKNGEAEPGAAPGAQKPEPKEVSSVTKHQIELDGRELAYTATAATTLLRDDDGEPRATVFTIAYILDGVADPSRRPLTFCFNGGPGSSSVWLHLGGLGPKRAAFDDPQHPPPPPYRLEASPETLLPHTDLVFVDPVGTGYSVPCGKAKLEDFATVEKDVASMGELVRLLVTRLRRWNSPKVLVGESYGGTRVGALAPHLGDRGMMVNAVVLVSPALDIGALEFQRGNDLPNVVYLPTYAAVAAYHGALGSAPADLDAFLREVRELALAEYAPALLRGSAISAEDRERIVARLAAVTGLSPSWIARHDLRIDIMRFCKELLRERGRTVGRLDARFLGRDSDTGGTELQVDPSFTAPMGPYTALMNDYVRGELGFEEERAYRIINMQMNESWKWEIPKGRAGGYPNVVGELRRAMLDNPHLEVVFLNGLYDLATPFFASETTARHLGSEPEIRAKVTEHTYAAGHMMYLHPPSRVRMGTDLARLYSRIGG
jgi:carboxypeptidase C (cathepsin A)